MSVPLNNSTAGQTSWQTKLLWTAVALLGAVAFAIVALNRGEAVNAAWLVVAAVCIYFIAYRFYGLFIADTALGVDATRPTPAERHNDGLDYVPTNRYVLYGHHFAAIAGAGPLVGPVLAAQMGYLPGTLWILAGAVFAGCVQDMTVLFLSTRRDGRSLGDIVRAEMGPVAGTIAGIGILLICVIVLAVLALVVVKALVGSPWGTFAVFCTIGHLQPVHPAGPYRRNVASRLRAPARGADLWPDGIGNAGTCRLF
jgi:carbon starvation protein